MRFDLDYKETHLKIETDKDLKERALGRLVEIYDLLEGYIIKDRFFQLSYEPVDVDEKSPEIVKIMSDSSRKANVGPMAAVAGTIAEMVGNFLLDEGADEVIAENGGDIFLKLKKPKIVGIHAGPSELSNKLAFRVKPEETPLGVCTSSYSVGHSTSLGQSDAVVVVSKSTALADAAATAVANEVKGKKPVENGIKKAKKISGIEGVLIIRGNRLGAWGNLPELVGRDFDLKQ